MLAEMEVWEERRKQCGPHRRLDRGHTIVHGTVRDPIIDGGWVHGCGVRPHMGSGVEVIEGVVLQKEEAKGEEPPKSHIGAVGENKGEGRCAMRMWCKPSI